MHNLVINQNKIYTYRRTVQSHSIRVSLLTKDKFEALQLVEHINITLALIYPLQKHKIKGSKNKRVRVNLNKLSSCLLIKRG